MVEAFHKVALACGKDEACLANARTSLKSTFDELKKVSSTVIPPNKAALFQEMNTLDKQWSNYGGKLALEDSKKVWCAKCAPHPHDCNRFNQRV